LFIMPASNRFNSEGAPKGATLRERLAAQDGLTLVEVAVTGLIVGLIALSLVGLDAVGRTTADQRRRAQAFEVAQADQERLRALSADQLSTLNQTRTVTLDAVAYSVTSTGQFISASAGSASCSSSAAAADYAKVTSTVTWASNRRADIVVQSLVTPRAGGSLLVQTIDQNGDALAGVRANIAGADPKTSAVRRFGTTDAGGCTIFGTLLVGNYTVSPALAGYVDKDGNAAPSSTVTTTAGNTTTSQFTLGQAGRVTANFETNIGSTTYPGQLAPSVSWFNAGMPSAINGFLVPSSAANAITTPQTLFPFFVTTPGTYTSNYNVWAGKCMAAQPPVGTYRRNATVAPGATWAMDGTSGHLKVAMPAMVISSVTYGGLPVKPAHILLTDSCNQSWQAPISSASTVPATVGWIGVGTTPTPGQPYGTYSICADYKFGTGSSSDPTQFRKVTVTNRANTDFTAANTSTIAISSSSPTGFC
jgi:Tfp pilus assembly protein PilV